MSMLIWLLPTLVAIALLLLLAYKRLTAHARVLSEVSVGLLVASMPFIATAPFTLFTKVCLIIAQAWAVMLPMRVIFGRLDKPFVVRSSRLNALIFLLIIAIASGSYFILQNNPGIGLSYWWRLELLLCGLIVVQVFFFVQLMWTQRHYKLRINYKGATIKNMPTVSVCIPARNEDHALEDCLQSVIASDYPKLEILVLDDCSQDKTSQIVRAFARDGVRFIQGDQPASGWLGRNQALQTLAAQANGDYILFMDVDTRLNPTSITQLMQYMLGGKLSMVTLLPQNRLGLQWGALLTNLRYIWQMMLPVTRRRVPVASQCWVIEATMLKRLGGFASVSHKIIPEASFAQRLAEGDAYRFVAGHTALGVTTAKRWPSELATAQRVLYPTYKRQPFFALLAMIAIALCLLVPVGAFVLLIALGVFNRLFIIACIALGLLLINLAVVRHRTHPRVWILTTLFTPLAAIQEVILIFISMLRYEFGEVNWKGRNVCYPVILSQQNQPATVYSPQKPERR